MLTDCRCKLLLRHLRPAAFSPGLFIDHRGAEAGDGLLGDVLKLRAPSRPWLRATSDKCASYCKLHLKMKDGLVKGPEMLLYFRQMLACISLMKPLQLPWRQVAGKLQQLHPMPVLCHRIYPAYDALLAPALKVASTRALEGCRTSVQLSHVLAACELHQNIHQ